VIEAAWSYRFPARLSRELLLARQENQPEAHPRHRLEGGKSGCVRAIRRLPGPPSRPMSSPRDRPRVVGFVWATPGM